MCCVKVLIVLSMTSFDLAIMARSGGTNQFVKDPELFEALFEQCGHVSGMQQQAFRELGSIIGLDTFDPHREGLEEMVQKDCGCIGVVLIKGFDIAPPGVFVNGSVLVVLFAFYTVRHAGKRDELHVDLDAFSGIPHLFIRLGYILRIWRFFGHQFPLDEESVQSGDRAGITPVSEFYPEPYEPGLRVSAAHIVNEFDLLVGVLIRMMVGPAGEIREGADVTIVAFQPAINELAVGFIANGGRSHRMFHCP